MYQSRLLKSKPFCEGLEFPQTGFSSSMRVRACPQSGIQLVRAVKIFKGVHLVKTVTTLFEPSVSRLCVVSVLLHSFIM